jgi:cysteine desulfuration protein SufE
MSEIDDAQRELTEEFAMFDNWMDRYQYLIDLGRQLPDYPEAERRDEDKLAGCQSQVWFQADARDGRMHYRAISDAAIVSGLIALLLRVYDGRPIAEVLASEPAFVTALGLDEHLSPTRANGLAAMLTAIHNAAREAGSRAAAP